MARSSLRRNSANTYWVAEIIGKAPGSQGSARVVDVESPEALAPDKADLLVNAERRPLLP